MEVSRCTPVPMSFPPLLLGMGFDVSPERKSHAQVRQAGIANCETHEVHLVRDESMTVKELQEETTPSGSRLMIVPKRGHGCKMSIYANHTTAPLLVTADLIDTLLQRLTHRARVFIWGYTRQRSKDIFDVVRTIRSLADPGTEREQLSGELHYLTYMDLVRIVEGGNDAQEVEDDEEEEEDEEGNFSSSTGRLLKVQYQQAKLVVDAEENLGVAWVESLLQVCECSILLSDTDTLDDWVPLAARDLRQQLILFTKSKTKQERIEGAHLFGSLLSRDFSREAGQATNVEEEGFSEDGRRVNTAPKFLLSDKPFYRLPVEQPLYGPKAFSCNYSSLNDREIILDDLAQDNERSLQALTEDVSAAPELLSMAVRFWKKHIAALKERRKVKQAKNPRKKLRLG